MTTLALDLSNYTTDQRVDPSIAAGGRLTDQLVQGWLANGFKHAIIGTQWPHVCLHQLELCHRNGMSLDLYSWEGWEVDPRSHLAACRALGQGYPVRRHWLDVEQTAGAPSQAEAVAQVREALAGLGGFPAGIYTGRYVYATLLGDTTEFSYLPLFLADYINRVPAQSEFKPFSGWQKVTAWQYAGSVQQMGANLDLDVIFEEANQLANLNDDGSQRIVSEGNFIVTYNKNIPVQRLGSTDGNFPGRMSKLFGNTWLWFRTLDANGQLVAPYWSADEGD